MNHNKFFITINLWYNESYYILVLQLIIIKNEIINNITIITYLKFDASM